MHQGWWFSGWLLVALFPGIAFSSPEFPAPRLPSRAILLQNTAYQAAYNATYKQSDWIFYGLGQNELRACVQRSNDFRPDPRLPANQAAQLSDYNGSNLDRGHLIPAGDNRWNATAMRESFLLSNISPQKSRFNSGVWAKFEGLVRAWAQQTSLWVATGPILKEGLPSIGASRVAVPEYFYKVLATREPGRRSRTIAFLLPANATSDIGNYAMSVNQLEEISGLDFLEGLMGEEEAESSFRLEDWDRKAKFTYLPCAAINPGAFDWAWGLSTQE